MSLKIRTAVVAVLAGASLMLAGCATTTQSPLDNHNDLEGKLVVAPVMPDYKVEVTLAKLNEILSAVELTNEQRARFHYDRGVIYDSVGLRLLARIDFMQALKLQPDLADAYNFLGIYYTQEGEYDSAYEAFDGVLELAPNYDYAYLNRGIALYYGDRNALAIKDMQAFYAGDNKDGYRALWLYLIESKDNHEQAKQRLLENRKNLDNGAWSTVIVDYYLGHKRRDDVFNAAKEGLTHPKEYAERLCEAYFYLAKMAIEQKQYQDAANYLRLTLATNIYDFVEHRYARIELAKVKGLLEDTK
ncbi:lipoprotein NlpI [Shewanella putrefaciens]|uniref:lipoprotein NlpI n=1 Tax=Shewanella putrefaciens TaxID=24 RepID=UPI00242B3478|nr:lipoprotein NlpI [Shewanella putrefaciens]MCA1895384.1 lipoprotein NlpI [Shewanella putrefaciens]